MRSSFPVLVLVVLAGACTPPGAVPVCGPSATWSAPSLRCATPGVPVAALPAPPAAPPAAAPSVVATSQSSIDLNETVQFETDSAILVERSKSLLDAVANELRAHPEIAKIRIEGHTDSTASRDHNQVLSTQRAETVKAYLIAKGVAASRMTTAGRGQDKPVADNGTEEGRYKNRRVEFQIVERK
jgi:outer membrane protein OmpA-like peptidoglycan-associated protein